MHGGTDITPFSTGTYASRSITMAGGAVDRACQILAGRLKVLAAHLLKCSPEGIELKSGVLYGPSGNLSVMEVAQTWHVRPELLANEHALESLEVTGMFKPKTDTGQYSYGTHAAVVSIDRATGAVDCYRLPIVEDCDRRVNPLIVEARPMGLRRNRDRFAGGNDIRFPRPTACIYLCRLFDARCGRNAQYQASPYRDAISKHRLRYQGCRGGRGDPTSGGNFQCGE